MMPGEAPGARIAAAAATACANCSALQQNLNEYVAALIALKQKIIDTDRLLTEYQQKCNELQLTERENNTLRHQVEQMLQKISPLEKCQQELGSLKAELEEKKSSLKIYQETHLEYARVKEEIVRSDTMKKKLEARVKKLEEAATKHMQDFKQLKTEKKVLEKELKKAQEKLDDFPKQKCKKVLKHAETQSAREDPVSSIDKGKIKLLLEELWMCIDSSTGRRQNQENDNVLASLQGRASRMPEKTGKLFTGDVAQSHQKFRKSDEKMLYPHSSPETIEKQNSLTTLQIKVNKEPHSGDHFESKTTDEDLQDYDGDSSFYEDKTIEVVVQTDLTDSSSDSSDQEQEQLGGNLLDILNWVRPLPPLLSPIQFSPSATEDMLFGETTDPSDEEIDHNAHIVESILEGKIESQSNCNFVSMKDSDEHAKRHEPNNREITSKLRENEETVIYIDTFAAKPGYIERDAEAKQSEGTVSDMNIVDSEEHSGEDSENIGHEETDKTVKAVTPDLEAINEKEVHTDQTHDEDKTSSIKCMSSSFQYLQEKSNELVPTEKPIATNLYTTDNSEHVKERSIGLMEAEEAELPEVETLKPASTHRGGVHLQTGEPIRTSQSALITLENFEKASTERMGSEGMENESSDIQTKSNTLNIKLCIEKHAEKVETTQEQVIAAIVTEGFCVEINNEARHNEERNVRCSFSNSETVSKAEHGNELVCQCNSERVIVQTKIDTEAKEFFTKSQCSEERFSNEEILDKQCEHTKQHGVNEEGGLESSNDFSHDSFVLATERSRDSLHRDGENHVGEVCKVAHSVSAKDGDGKQLRTGEQCVVVNLTLPEQKVLSSTSANKKDFLETCEFAEPFHVMDTGELLDAKEEGCLQAKLDHEPKNASKLLQKKPDFKTTFTSPKPAFGINGETKPLELKEMVKTNVLLAPELVAETEMRQAKNIHIASEHRSSKVQNCVGVFEPQGIEVEMDCLEVTERSSRVLESEKIDTLKSVTTEREHASWAQFWKPVESCSITENSQCDKIREILNDKLCETVVIQNCKSSPDLEENDVEEVEMGNQISDVKDQVVSKENAVEEAALSIDDVLETENIDTEEINTPVTAAAGLESTAVSTDFTAFNHQENGEPSKQNYQAVDISSEEYSVTALNIASSPTRGNEKCNDHVIQSVSNYSLGNLVKGKTLHNDKEMIGCLTSKHENKNRAEIENEKEQSNDKEPQKTLVTIQILDTSSVDSGMHAKKEASLGHEEAKCETRSQKEIITERVVLKETSPHRVEPLQASDGQVRRRAEDRSDETIKNKDKELNIIKLCEEKNGNKNSENTSEVPEETDESEEDFPFRKVKYTKQHEHFLVFNEKLITSRTYTMDVPVTGTAADENNDQMCELPSSDTLADLAVPCLTSHSPSIVRELSPLSETHGTVFHKDENNEKAYEHRENSKIIQSVSDSENSLIKLEELTASAEVSKKIPRKQTTSEINLLPNEMLAKCSEIYKNAVKNSELDMGVASCNFSQINHDEKFASNVEQSVTCDASIEVSKAHTVFPEELNDDEETPDAFASVNINTNITQDDCQSCYDGSCSDAFLKETDFQRKDSKTNSIKSSQHPPLSVEIADTRPVNQTSESQKAVLENTHVVESESAVDLVSKNSHQSKCKVQEPSNVLNVSAKTLILEGQSRLTQRVPRGKEKTKSSQVQVTQPVLANADTSTPTKRSSETISKIRQEMGPPLPPLLPPLISTPPRTMRPVSPMMSSSSRSSLPSPLDDLISPIRDTPLPPLMSPLSDAPKYKSPPVFSTPSPSETAVSRRILSSPLQFCAATPKHALPVPGRLPPSAAGSGASDACQENSVKILDTMYPELSARARTLSILKGNMQPNRCAPLESKNVPGPMSQFSGFKAITSTSTAFVKTGSNSESHCSKDQKDSEHQNYIGKRTLSSSMPRSAKRLRLDRESPQFETKEDVAVKAIGDLHFEVHSAAGKTLTVNNNEMRQLESPSPVQNTIDPVTLALKKIAESCFDLLPVIRSHVYVGNISKVPVMRDEEKEVVHEFGITNKHLAERLLHAILNKLKTQKMSLNHNFTQALCRVYIGLCRQLGDLERARLFCYSLLKEDFPESAKLILFITSVWVDIFSFQGVINKAMQLVVRQRARGEVLNCLTAYLSWEKSPPLDTGIMVSSLLLAIQLCPKLEFQLSEQYGEDLSESTWEYIFAIELLCSHLKWGWTHDNIISKELWPVMDKWVKQRKAHETVQSIPDIIVASTLRLIGHLGQIGLKEGFFSAVKNISFVIGSFIQHAKEEDVPWGVQLAAVYALCDLGPSNPLGVMEVIQAWRTVTTNSIPTAVTSGIAEVSSLGTAELH